MATFSGTIDEFHCFIGPRVRNSINVLTRNARVLRNGVCELCGKQSVLESAHVHGRGRRTIIEGILSSYVVGEIVNVNDIMEVERAILSAHLPVSNSFIFLCKQCHRAYDDENNHTEEGQKMTATADIKCASDYLRRLRSVGIETFVEHFEHFLSLPNKEIIELLMRTHGYTRNSAATKASVGRRIARDDVAREHCLNYILLESSVSDRIKRNAYEIQAKMRGAL